MVCRELQQELVQACPLLGLEWREELVLHALGDRSELGELPLACREQGHDMPPAVGRVTPTLDQALLFELVEQPDEPAPVVAERIDGGAILDHTIDDLLLQARGLVLVREVLAGRGASPAELDAYTRELERVRRRLAQAIDGS